MRVSLKVSGKQKTLVERLAAYAAAQ